MPDLRTLKPHLRRRDESPPISGRLQPRSRGRLAVASVLASLVLAALYATPLRGQTLGQPSSLDPCAGDDPPVSCLPIFKAGYPRAFFFRSPEHPTRFQTYPEWRSTFGRLNGVVAKTVGEELANLAPDVDLFMASFAAERDDQLVMLHFNGNALDPHWRLDGQPVHDRFSAGHWLYFPGTHLTQNVSDSPGETWIHVADVAPFRDDIGLANAGKADDIVLVPLDGGQKLWGQAEHMTVLEIDGTQNRLRVGRGVLSTQLQSFTAGQTYVAPHVHEGPWGHVDNHLLWHYNLSSACPIDSQGQTAGDALARLLGDLLSPRTAPDGRDFHGVQLDIAPWWKDRPIEGRVADVDNDGLPDGGILGDRNAYGQGVHAFYTELRRVLGEDRLILADGGAAESQRAVGVLNGMEAEGFSGFNDATLDNWSTAVNRLTYWRDRAGQDPRLTWVVHKDPTATPSVSRLVMAASQILGLPVTNLVEPGPERGHSVGIWDELRKGDEELYHWLGGPRTTALQPLGAPQRLARQTPDLLQGAGQRLDSTFLAGWTSDDATIVPIGDALRFNATQPCTGARVHTCMTVRYSGLTIPAGDLTVFFDVRADPLAGFPTDVPRDITVRALGQQPGAPTTQGLRTYAGGSDFTSSFYFRDAGPATIDLEIEIEGGGPVYLSNLTAHAATDALAREYHRGAAIANPSLSDLSFDLGQLFPGRTFRRLQASQLQDAVHNHGGPQTQQGSISSLDGLFLVDDREPVSDFTAAPYGANGGVTVQFTDQSTGVDRDQYWDFGDGSPVLRCEPSCSPEHTYTERGYYTVKLTSRNAHGRQAQRREGHIVIGDTETWRADDDFSSVQGHRGWSYFGWDGDYQALDFQGGFWRWEPQAASNWTRIYPTYDHPHHAESARAWRSPRHGAARITGRVRKANVGGDGVTASIYLGDERIGGPWSIAGGDTTGVPFDLEVPIRQGQSLYFRLHRNGDHFSDATRWQDLRIDLTSLELPAVDFTVIRPANQTPPRAIFQNDTLVPVETPTVRWAWDFDDDGDVDSWREQGFSFYPEPGSYDVRLRAENDAGWGEELKEDAVVVVPSQPQTWVAADGFSGQQGGADGQNPWLYLEWNGATGAYQPLTWQGDHWRGTTVWTRIYASYDHPDGYPVARAWQAPWPGTARIQGQVRLTNPAGCGDGVRAWLFHDDIVIGGPYDLAAGDSVGQSIDVSVPVQEGDIVYFRTHRLGDVACDATSWGQSITLTP